MKTPPLRWVRPFLLAASVLLGSLTAQGETPSEGTSLRVGIHDKPPYAYQDSTGNWYGLGVELWEVSAKKNGWEFSYVELPYEELLPALVAGKIDIVVGELFVNPEDESVIDFSQPFIESSVGIAVASRNWHPNWFHILTNVFDWTMLRVLYGFIPALLLISFVIWWLEKNRTDGHFSGTPSQGIGSAFWFSAVTMTSTGYGDKVPVTFLGRTVAVGWMIVGLMLVTAFTASVASTVATVRTGSLVRSPADLRHYRNGAMEGGVASHILDRYSAPVVSFESYENALEELASGSIDTVVGDSLSLEFLIHQQYSGHLTLLPMSLYSSRVAFALPADSSLRQKLNVSLLEKLHSPNWPAILLRYLGHSYHAPVAAKPSATPPNRPPSPKPRATP